MKPNVFLASSMEAAFGAQKGAMAEDLCLAVCLFDPLTGDSHYIPWETAVGDDSTLEPFSALLLAAMTEQGIVASIEDVCTYGLIDRKPKADPAIVARVKTAFE